MSSLLKHSPGISPRFFSQNTAQKLPEKKIPWRKEKRKRGEQNVPKKRDENGVCRGQRRGYSNGLAYEVARFGAGGTCQNNTETFSTSSSILSPSPHHHLTSTAAKATMRSAKLARSGLHHRSAHLAFRRTHGTVSIALNRCVFSAASLTYVSMRRL